MIDHFNTRQEDKIIGETELRLDIVLTHSHQNSVEIPQHTLRKPTTTPYLYPEQILLTCDQLDR